MPGGARVSDSAIERDRISSRARYQRNKDQQLKTRKVSRDEALKTRPFIGWDGEGYTDENGDHHYMLFGASTGDCITSPSLSTTECLELIIQVERKYPTAYHVGFAFEYDVNMILKDLPWRALAILKECGHCRWTHPKTNQRYRIEHIPGKWFRVATDGASATIYNCFGFFHCGYMSALKKYGIGDESKLTRIAAGKAERSNFTYADIEMVKAYWLAEISLLPPLMECIRKAAHNGSYYISEWHGPGALAAYLLRDQSVSKWHSKDKTPPEVKSAIRHAYAGGRFTGALCGLYIGPVYTADLNSAYIYACSLLPRMDRGAWKRQAANDVDPGNLARFGLYRIEFDYGREAEDTARRRGVPEPPYPLFHRSKNGVLRWPRKCIGWYWTPEAELVLGAKYAHVLEAWIFNDNGSYPFGFVHDAYNRRVEMQRRGDPAEKAYKWALAAMYGAFARRVGWNKQTRKAPPSHELAWAGYITSWCRANVYKPAFRVWQKGNGRGLISIDTDGVCATVPFSPEDLPNGVGEALGQWKLEEWSGILQWQNGIYWLRDSDGNWRDPKSRGIPKGSIPFAAAFEALEKMDYSARPFIHPQLTLVRTRFVGYSQALRGQFGKWRKWLTEPVSVMMGGNLSGKAAHVFMFCGACRAASRGVTVPPEDVRGLHTITGTAPEPPYMSHPHKLPWLEDQPDLPPGFIEDEFNAIVRDEDI
jgi:DNA polymerase family B